MTRFGLWMAAVVALHASACTDSEADTASGVGGAGGGPTASYTSLITGEWQLDAFSEKTSDTHFVTLDRDIYVGAIRPIAPIGTHHTVLATSYLGKKTNVYGAGVGTNELQFPPGVGLKLSAGTTLVLDLHLFNTSADPISGTSGIEIVEVDRDDVVDEVDVFLPGPLDLTIPPNQESTTVSTCTATAEFTVFAMIPHMHQLGTHLKTTVTAGDVETVLHDSDYSFDEQFVHPIEPIVVRPGNRITTECTYTNPTSEVVGWGVSSADEMCFSVLYRYPAQDDAGFCDR